MSSVAKIKVCGITCKEDAKTAINLGADLIGLNCYPHSPRVIASDSIGDIFVEIPRGKRVYVNVLPLAADLKKMLDLGFDFFQVHFDLGIPISSLATWSETVGAEKLWLAPRIPPGESFPRSVLEYADTFMLDSYAKSKYGGTGKTSNWKMFYELQALYSHKKWILSGGLNAENIRDALAATEAQYIDVNSGVESSPGVKDAGKLETFIKNAR
jgi:phosphoribosylanthranilate isomerase